MNKKENIIIFSLIIIICILTGIVIYLILPSNKYHQSVNNQENVIEKPNDINQNQVLEKLVGEWGTCHNNGSCYGTIISKKDNKFYYKGFTMWTDGQLLGEIINVTKEKDDEYIITVHFDEDDGNMSYTPEQTIEYHINIKEIANNIIKIQENNYTKITGDYETFFENLNSSNKENVDTKNILNTIVGEWGTCHNNGSCYGTIISQDDDKYYYYNYTMWSGGTYPGEVIDIKKESTNEYTITVHYDAYDNELGSADEQTISYKINFSKLAENKIIIGNYTYAKITGDRETFFSNLLNH